MMYRLADKNIEIKSLFPKVQELCRGYETDGKADFTISITRADIAFERERSSEEGMFHDAYLETLAVYRKIAEKMPYYNTLLFHGSCIAVDGEAYLFTAKSGTGKSTHARLWRELLGERAVMVNDDKPLLRLCEGRAIVYGTPWDGKHHLSTNVAVPLKALCILERGKENYIERMTRSEAFPMLLQQAYRPMDAAALGKTLSLIDELSGCVTLYRLRCNMDLSAAQLSYDTMKGQRK